MMIMRREENVLTQHKGICRPGAEMTSLAVLLSSAFFLNEGTVTRNATFTSVPIDCLYLEPENVTLSSDVWAVSNRLKLDQAGPCTYVYALNSSAPAPPPSANCSAVTPATDRPGGDYNAVTMPTSTACAAACCGDAACESWVWVPAAPAPFLGCVNTTQPCCYKKSTAPVPAPSSIPGITSGVRLPSPEPGILPPPSGMRSAVPLGGVGCGSFEIRADGSVHEWTLHSASPAGNAKLGTVSDFILGVRAGGAARALRTAGAAAGAAGGVAVGVDALTYRGSWPMSRFDVNDDALTSAGAANISVSAYSAFKPGDLNASATPAVSFTLMATNTAATPLNVSLLLILPRIFNDCYGDAGSPKVTSVTPSAAACAAACAAAPATQCSNFWWDAATGVCTQERDLHQIGYRAGAACGVRGEWSSDVVAGAPALTLQQRPAACVTA